MTRIFLLTFAALLPLSAVLAQTELPKYSPMVTIPFVGESANIENYINAIYLLAISIAAVLAVLKITIAGVKYIMSDVVTSKEDAKKDIRGALFGLIIVLAAFVILNTINPQLTNYAILSEGGANPAEDAAPGRSVTSFTPAVNGLCTNPTDMPAHRYQKHPETGVYLKDGNGNRIYELVCIPKNSTPTDALFEASVSDIEGSLEEGRAAAEAGVAAEQARQNALNNQVGTLRNGRVSDEGGGAAGICEGRASGFRVGGKVSGPGSCRAGTNFREDTGDDTDAVSGWCVCP